MILCLRKNTPSKVLPRIHWKISHTLNKMIKVNKNQLSDIYRTVPMQYELYLQWLDEEDPNQSFFIVSTYNYDIHDRELWNTLGREIYDAKRLAEHASKIIAITNIIGAKAFIIQHEYSPGVWFPDSITKNIDTLEIANERVSNIQKSLPRIHLDVFDGAFEIADEFPKLMTLFIDYPFLFKYKNIDLISKDLDLIIKITNHLDVQFITQDSALANAIKRECFRNHLPFQEVIS